MKKELLAAEFIQEGIGFKDLADFGIILESKPILDAILQLNYDFRIVSSYHLDYDWYLLNINDVKIAFAVSQGAAMAVDLAERYRTSGVKHIVRIGTIGSLKKELKLGEYIIPYAAIKDEGTSDFYIEPKSPAIADVDFTQMISNILRQRGNIVHNGITWSTDGRWKETDAAIERRISDGAIGTDMESSALFAFGIDRKTPVASISVLSDEILDSEGDFKGLSDKEIWFNRVLPKATEAFESLIQVAIQLKKLP